MNKLILLLLALTVGGMSSGMSYAAPLPFSKNSEKKIEKAIAGDHRTESNKARNQYRHPEETLMFFGLKSNMTVVEIWPGAGWYTEVLAPVLKRRGKFYVAGFDMEEENTPAWRKSSYEVFINKIQARPDVYGNTIVSKMDFKNKTMIKQEGTADMVLTFRNVHNWMKDETQADAVFEAAFKALKPGGILGVVEHRAKPGTSLEDMIKSGYVTEEQVIILAQKAGFEWAAKSEINANAKDSKDHPAGVWTLPPSLRLGEKDKEKYLAIGESDRMTLKFVKPGKPEKKKLLQKLKLKK